MRLNMLHVLPLVFSFVVSTASGSVQTPAASAESQEAAANLEKNNYAVVESSVSTGEDTDTLQVYNHKTGKTMTLSMENYLQGVVRGEMQASYPEEALKAQAVAARTYVYYLKNAGSTHGGTACVCTDPQCCQAWMEPDPDWAYDEKVRNAVRSTQGVVVTYEGQPIKAMYFSASGGYTESYENVWDDVPCAYLQSVPSRNEQAYNFTDNIFVQEFSSWTVLRQLRNAGYAIACDSAQLVDTIGAIQRSDTGRVISLEIGGVQLSGAELRACLGLRSTHFYIQKMSDGGINIITMGYGHGVGMSQCGAAAMAADGYDYVSILQHYYTDVTVEWMPFH